MTSRPRATYDPDSDTIGIDFAPAGAEYLDCEEIAPSLVLDDAVDGRVIGVELAGVRQLRAARSRASLQPAAPAAE